jgi:hypothetical protein
MSVPQSLLLSEAPQELQILGHPVAMEQMDPVYDLHLAAVGVAVR